MNKISALFISISLFFFPIFNNFIIAQNSYPTPSLNKDRLFYIQRSGNTNTIMYDANFAKEHKLDPNHPINTYWVIYDEGGKKKDLNFFQRKLAYGIDFKPLGKINEYEFTLVSYPKKKLYLHLDSNGIPFAVIDINGKKANLHKVFVKIDPSGIFSLSPKVKYVELFGFDPVTGIPVYEKIIIST
jgi:hypothetical protein